MPKHGRHVIYLRCSTDDQSKGDYTTIDTQREINTGHVRAIGGTLIREYADEGKTGTNLKRQGWRNLLRDAADGQFDTVVVTYMSRLARGNAFHVASYLLQECGVKIQLVRETFTNDLAGSIVRDMTIFQDGLYSKMVSGWVRTKMEKMVESGYWCGGHPPVGYKPESVFDTGVGPYRLVFSDDHSIVLRAFETLSTTGRISAVRDYLNSVIGRTWTTSRVRALLTNQLYIGHYQHGSWRHENCHPAIVSKELWDDVQARLQVVSSNFTRQRQKPLSPGYTYYLHGLIRCPHCGGNYTNAQAKGGRVHYYQCVNDAKRLSDCPVKRINADALHDTVIREIERAAGHETVMHALIASSAGWGKADADQYSDRAQLARKLQFIGARKANLLRAIEEKPLRTLMDALERLETEEVETAAALELATTEIKSKHLRRPTAKEVQGYWSRLVELWPYVEEQEKPEVMQAFIDEIVVTEKCRINVFLTPTPEIASLKFALTVEKPPRSDHHANYPHLVMRDVEVRRTKKRRAA